METSWRWALQTSQAQPDLPAEAKSIQTLENPYLGFTGISAIQEVIFKNNKIVLSFPRVKLIMYESKFCSARVGIQMLEINFC